MAADSVNVCSLDDDERAFDQQTNLTICRAVLLAYPKLKTEVQERSFKSMECAPFKRDGSGSFDWHWWTPQQVIRDYTIVFDFLAQLDATQHTHLFPYYERAAILGL